MTATMTGSGGRVRAFRLVDVVEELVQLLVRGEQVRNPGRGIEGLAYLHAPPACGRCCCQPVVVPTCHPSPLKAGEPRTPGPPEQLPEAGPFEMNGGRLFVADDSTEPGGLTHHLVQTGGAEVLLDPISALLVHHFLQARAGKDV